MQIPWISLLTSNRKVPLNEIYIKGNVTGATMECFVYKYIPPTTSDPPVLNPAN